MRRRYLARLRGLARDQRGIALLEFAIVLPVLVLLFVGGFQLMDAISAYRKVGKTVRTLADLTTQNTTITPGQADEILNAAQQVMTPYSLSNATLRISQVQLDASSRATVSWSRALNGTALAPGTAMTLPPQLVAANKYYIYSEITYTYAPGFGSALVGTIPLSQTIYMSPRNSSFVACNSCPT